MPRHNRFLPLIVFFFACCFLAILLLSIKPDVFFSGDAGLKFLVIKQINNTGEYKYLDLRQPQWVQQIWQQGFYPFKEPFIYDTSQGKLVAFPPAFQWLNAPLYKLFGYRGIYIIPCLSLVLLWLWFLATLRQAGTGVNIISFGLLLMVCSPLTLYAAVYWEHTLAILLVFGGVAFLMRQSNSFLQSQMLGLITGLSIWFRPEAIILSSLIAAVALYNFFTLKKVSYLFFILGYIAVLIAFFTFNAIVYRSILGAHAYQVMGHTGYINNLQAAFTILTHINARFLIFFPAAGLFYVLAVHLLKRPALPILIYQLAVVVILYALVTPFILPNAGGKQWGPRYFLPLIPLMLTTVCLASGYISSSRRWIILVIPLMAYSGYLNVYKAEKTLRNDYASRIGPGMSFLRNLDCDVVVVQNQYIAQEFSAAFDKKIFFLAEDDTNFNFLTDQLRRSGVSSIVYMDVNNRERSFTDSLNKAKTRMMHIGDYFFAQYLLK